MSFAGALATRPLRIIATTSANDQPLSEQAVV
jgi:hypothetical protein